MTSGACTTPLPAQTDLVLGTSPFSISASELNPLGYTYTLCYSCDILPITGLPMITFIKDLITVSEKALDCSESISDNILFDKNPPSINYDSAGSNYVIADSYLSIFNHQ